MQFPFTIKDPRPYNETLQIYLANKLTSKDTITNRNYHRKKRWFQTGKIV